MFVYSFLDLKLFIHRYNDILWIFLLVFDDSPSSELLPGHMHNHVESATTLSYVSCKRDYQFWFNEDFKSSAPCLVLTKAIVTNNSRIFLFESGLNFFDIVWCWFSSVLNRMMHFLSILHQICINKRRGWSLRVVSR